MRMIETISERLARESEPRLARIRAQRLDAPRDAAERNSFQTPTGGTTGGQITSSPPPDQRRG